MTVELLGWSLLLCLFLRCLQFSAACPAAGYPLAVMQPFWLQLPVLLLRWSYACWVCGVFGAALGFQPCAVLFLRRLRFCAGYPSGFLPFLTPSA